MEYNGKRVLVLGAGRTGKAVGRFLRERGAILFLYDDGGGSDGGDSLCSPLDFAVISPGFSLSHKAVSRLKERGVPILSELDLAYINCKSKRIFAVSGTNGKTTTCMILREMLSTITKAWAVGNIGVPFIEKVDGIEEKDAVVVEVSSFQIEQSGVFKPEIAALTNVGEDHLDRHRDRETYQAIKLSLCARARKAVINADDPVQAGITGVRYSCAGANAEFTLRDRALCVGGKAFILPKVSRGEGYDRDYLCAFAVACTAYGFKRSFLRAYERTEIPPFRRQQIGTLRGAAVINDSKGTNIDATLFAVSTLSGRVAIILGGSDKGEDYSRLMRGLSRVERIYLCGANAMEMYLASDEETKARCLLMADLESCVRDFTANPLETLLFSPASASFDLYSDYEERGRRFNAIIEKYRRA